MQKKTIHHSVFSFSRSCCCTKWNKQRTAHYSKFVFPRKMGNSVVPPPLIGILFGKDLPPVLAIGWHLHITLPTHHPNFPWMDIRIGKMVSKVIITSITALFSFPRNIQHIQHHEYDKDYLSPSGIIGTRSTRRKFKIFLDVS